MTAPAPPPAEASFRPVSRSRTTMAEMMIPAYANFGGKIHGGIILGLMDKVAYATAAKHAGRYCVTVSVDGVDFKAPVEVGELVALRASVNYVGRTSMVIGIHVDAEDVATGVIRHTSTSYVTMVAKDEAGRPAPVPGLLLETKDDVRRFLEAIKRRALRRRYLEELDNAHTALTVAAELPTLAAERCRLADGLVP